MVNCQLGHASHDVIEVSTVQGRFKCFDVPKYASDEPGWCLGRYNVSDRLIVEGHWEPHDSVPIESILRAGDRSRLVIDFGANVGWYTIMAAKLGYDVLAIDDEAENISVLRQNAELHRVEYLVTAWQAWVDEGFTLDTGPAWNRQPAINCDVELVKIDLESHDRHAVSAVWPFIDRVHNLYVEISPAFRDDYPDLVNRLVGAGFSAFYPSGAPFDKRYDEGQFNLRFSRCKSTV